MEPKIKTLLVQIAIPVICYLIFGILFIGMFVIQPSNSLFTFTIYGFAAILFYNLIIHYGIRHFLLLGALFAILMLIIFKPSADIIVDLRNFTWYVVIGVLAYAISYYEKKNWYKQSQVWTASVWFIGFICVYIIMAVLNIYLYRLYHVNERFTVFFYIGQSIKLGGVLGAGIGLGNWITKTFVEKPSSAENQNA